MEGSRDRILGLLQRNNRATVEQMSRYMELASATVRRHLDILQRDRLVTYEQVKKRTGRPEYTYYLTEEGQEHMPKGYGRLLGSLLDEISGLCVADIEGQDGTELLELVFQRVAQKSVGDIVEWQSRSSLAERLERLMAFMEAEQFQPEARVANGQVRIALHNCPFRSVAMIEPRVCEYDHAVLTAILGTEVSRVECIRDGSAGCCYVASIEGEASQA